jgi:hypothetical protein
VGAKLLSPLTTLVAAAERLPSGCWQQDVRDFSYGRDCCSQDIMLAEALQEMTSKLLAQTSACRYAALCVLAFHLS